jgi:hypothetical protein
MSSSSYLLLIINEKTVVYVTAGRRGRAWSQVVAASLVVVVRLYLCSTQYAISNAFNYSITYLVQISTSPLIIYCMSVANSHIKFYCINHAISSSRTNDTAKSRIKLRGMKNIYTVYAEMSTHKFIQVPRTKTTRHCFQIEHYTTKA